MSGRILSFIVPSIIILSLVILIAGIVAFILRVRRGQPLSLRLPFFLTGYFYFISLLSLIILASGLSTLVGAGLTTVLGKEFTYQKINIIALEPPPPSPVPEGAPAPAKPARLTPEERKAQEERRINMEFRRDLIGGGILAVVSLAVWLSHTIGRRRLEKRRAQGYDSLGKAYRLLLLGFFSVASLIVLASAIQQMVNYYIFEPLDVRFFGSPQPPGGSVAQVIVFVPIWILSLRSVLQCNGAKVAKGEDVAEKS